MNTAEEKAMKTFIKGEGILHWVKIDGRGLWLYIHPANGKVFEYIPETDNVEGTDCMREVSLR